MNSVRFNVSNDVSVYRLGLEISFDIKETFGLVHGVDYYWVPDSSEGVVTFHFTDEYRAIASIVALKFTK